MRTNRTILLQLQMTISKGSTRGCGRRYVLRGITPQGEIVRVETNPCSESNWTCDFHTRTAVVFQVVVRAVDVVQPVADQWATSASSGVDLESEFERQKAIATTQEKIHGK
jgi:hypothetical protein